MGIETVSKKSAKGARIVASSGKKDAPFFNFDVVDNIKKSIKNIYKAVTKND